MPAKAGPGLPTEATEFEPKPQQQADWDAFFDRPGIGMPDREQPLQGPGLNFDTGEPDVAGG